MYTHAHRIKGGRKGILQTLGIQYSLQRWSRQRSREHLMGTALTICRHGQRSRGDLWSQESRRNRNRWASGGGRGMLYNSWNKTPVPGAALARRGQEFQLRVEIFIAGIPHGTLYWYGPGLAPPLDLTPRAGLCLQLVAQTFHCWIVQGRWPGNFSSLWHETARPTPRSEPLLGSGT